MNPEVSLKIQLNPHVKQDKKTGLYLAFYDEFPDASASGTTSEEAKRYLNELIKVMLQEKRSDMINTILDLFVTNQKNHHRHSVTNVDLELA